MLWCCSICTACPQQLLHKQLSLRQYSLPSSQPHVCGIPTAPYQLEHNEGAPYLPGAALQLHSRKLVGNLHFAGNPIDYSTVANIPPVSNVLLLLPIPPRSQK